VKDNTSEGRFPKEKRRDRLSGIKSSGGWGGGVVGVGGLGGVFLWGGWGGGGGCGFFLGGYGLWFGVLGGLVGIYRFGWFCVFLGVLVWGKKRFVDKGHCRASWETRGQAETFKDRTLQGKKKLLSSRRQKKKKGRLLGKRIERDVTMLLEKKRLLKCR